MNERAIVRGWHYGQLVFVALVTAILLSFTFELASGQGFGGLTGMVLWSFSAGFGLEFLRAGWGAVSRT